MKYLLILLIIASDGLNAQTNLSFDKRFVQSEDRWVAFKPEKDSAYAFGYIYIDPQAGLTFNYEGTFTIASSGEFLPKKLDTTSLKVRLEPNNILVAFIPDSKFPELDISKIPEWLKYYKTDTNSVERLYRWGYMYNGWGECAKALEFLEKAANINPTFSGLTVELAYSYNCMAQYDKAETVLENAIRLNPADAYTNKEYIYTLSKNNKIDIAVRQFEKSSTMVKDKQYDAENCYNIMQYFYSHANKEQFNKWYKLLQTKPTSNEMITQYAENMKRNLEK